jgi:hypothetical protein
MANIVKNEVKYNHFFDEKTKRHKINGFQSVLHCHHYTSLYTQLALDAGEAQLLKECSRESFRQVLTEYFGQNSDLTTIQAKMDVGCQYFSLVGLGKLKAVFLGDESGLFELPYSHTDSGWLKKWGQHDRPVNYISAGFIEALAEAVLELPAKSFEAIETQSIVMGAETSTFKLIRR